jgi:hypothetical protein
MRRSRKKMGEASVLTASVGELSAAEVRTLLARTQRSTKGRGAELRPRLREAVREGELSPEEVLRRLDEETLEALLAFHGIEGPPRKQKHSELLARLAAAIHRELALPTGPRAKHSTRAARPGQREREPGSDLDRLRDDLDRLLDERARLEAKNVALERELERLREDLNVSPGLDATPDDLGELLRQIGIGDAHAYKRLYRPAAKLLHPDKNKEGEPAFRLLTKIRDLLEGK